MTPSNHMRPACGRSKTQVSDTSNWRKANSYPYPARSSARVNGQGRRSSHRQKKLWTAAGPRRSQIFCSPAGVRAGAETVIQRLITGAGFLQLPLGPFMPVEPKPNRKRGIGVGLPERSTPFRIPEIKIEVIDIGHLPTPIHVGMGCLLLSFPRPRPPNRGLLLCDADQHYAILCFTSCRFQVRASQLFFILSLVELHDGDLMFFGKAVDGFYVLLTNLAKCSRGRNLELLLPAQEFTHIPNRLKFGYVGLQEDS